MRSATAVVVLGWLLGLVLVGCSGGRPKPSASPVGSASPSTSSSSASASASPLGGAAGPINLRSSDFPAGWTATPAPGAGGGNDPGATALLACLKLPAADRSVVADTSSDVFASGQAVQASSDVTIVSSATIGAQEVDALRTGAGLTCLGQVIGQAVSSQGVGVSGATVRAIPAPRVGGGPSMAAEYGATFTVGEQTLTAVTDEYFFARGTEQVTATFTAYGQPFPAAVEKTAVDNLASRVTAS